MFHSSFWIYVTLGSFLSKGHARFILLYVVPFTYLLHTLARKHFLVEWEKELSEKLGREIFDLDNFYHRAKTWCDENCTCNPLSAQGMLILGAIVSSSVLLRF